MLNYFINASQRRSVLSQLKFRKKKWCYFTLVCTTDDEKRCVCVYSHVIYGTKKGHLGAFYDI